MDYMYAYSMCPYHFLLVTHCLQTPSALFLVSDDRAARKSSDWLIASTAGPRLLVMSYSVLEWRLSETAETAGGVELVVEKKKHCCYRYEYTLQIKELRNCCASR